MFGRGPLKEHICITKIKKSQNISVSEDNENRQVEN